LPLIKDFGLQKLEREVEAEIAAYDCPGSQPLAWPSATSSPVGEAFIKDRDDESAANTTGNGQ